MAAAWRPYHSSDEEDFTFHTDLPNWYSKNPAASSPSRNTAHLFTPIEKPTPDVNVFQNDVVKPPPKDNNHDSSENDCFGSGSFSNSVFDQMTSKSSESTIMRSESTDSITEMLRQSGIDSEVANSRNIKWRKQFVATNHISQSNSGLHVPGTSNLYLDDDFFKFSESDEEVVPDTIKQPIVAPESPERISYILSENKTPLKIPTKSKKKKDTLAKFTKITEAKVKGRKTTWKKVDLSEIVSTKICPYGPAEGR